jgi:cytidylate kinase
MEVQYSYENNIITLDGPAGSGKSTIARLVAERLGYEFLDTGALYRGVTYFLFTRSIEPSETGRIAEALKECVVSFEAGKVFVDGKDVSKKIRSPEIDRFVSAYSALPVVRNFLLETQRRAAAGRMIVAEGRDMGSVVFPEAPFKFYLDARPYVRAARRWKELEARGEKLTLEEVERQLQRRDNLDSGRALSPLRVPEKAHIIDTSEKTIHEVVDEIMAIMAGRKDP